MATVVFDIETVGLPWEGLDDGQRTYLTKWARSDEERARMPESLSLWPLTGKIVVLVFWATWCGPCLKAMPKLEAFARRHPEIAVLAINLDDAVQARAIFSERGYTLTLLAGDQKTSDRYGVTSIPHTVLIDRAGTVRRVFRGSVADLEREVALLLK